MKIAKSVYEWFDRRYDLTPVIEKNVTGKQVPRHLTWPACFGGLALFCFLVQMFTGVLLMMYYKPQPDQAFDSVMFIKSNVQMGWLVQRIHVVSANIMIVLVIMHMCRVAYRKIYRPPRELHWVSGIILLFLTLIEAFTGYLLPWTQLSYWGAKVGTEIPGAVPGIGTAIVEWVRRGQNISGDTLGFFYACHVAIVPGIVILFMVMHFVMIRRTGISEPL